MLGALRRLVVWGAWLCLASCAEGRRCSVDGDCPSSKVCIWVREAGAVGERRCRATCVSDIDCLLALEPGKSCRPLQDGATGPATMEVGARVAEHRANVDRTTRGVIRVCRGSRESMR
jgi:hypothetical protein